MSWENMQLPSADPETFRAEVRAWFAANFPPELRDAPPAEDEAEKTPSPLRAAWKKALAAKGWGTPTWPEKYGGGGLNSAQADIVRREMARVGAWNPMMGIGVMMFGPTLLEFGTEAQKSQHIPAIVRGDINWCQGYSEPGAGSDLASLQTSAVDMGDHFLVNGQKVWTSQAQQAHWCFALVRTDRARKRDGISFLLIDMKSPGVEVRPIRLISGDSFFCETFFTDVRVPKENLVGPLNGGWTIGKRLLQFERSSISDRAGRAEQPSLADLAKEGYVAIAADGRIADSDLRQRIISYEMDNAAFALTTRRVAHAQTPSATSSILKNVYSRLLQERGELAMEIMGWNGLGAVGGSFSERELEMVRSWLFDKAATIYGGSHEIQNNIIAKRILGLPDSVSPDERTPP
jgi:alkylation response protein AidB-like acyl-CoA dehydrogenase